MPAAGELALPYGFGDTLAHSRHWRPGVVQEVAPAGVLDLGPGYIEPGLLPVRLVRDAYARAMEEYGAAALGYGHNPGAMPLRAQLASRIRAEGHPCEPDQVLVTAGTSQALHLLATVLASPGDTVLLQELSYDLGERIFRDCSLRPRRIAMDASGMCPASLRHALAEEAGCGGAERGADRTAFVYLTPTHHNPTGATMPLERRRELLDITAEFGVLVIEDDAYGELSLTEGEPSPPTLAALAGHRGVLRLGSFSKTLGPGLRLGWLVTEPALAERLASHNLFVSGGSLNHLASLAVGSLLADGSYDRHLGLFRDQLRLRRDALVGALRRTGEGLSPVSTPQGGFFVWLPSGHVPRPGPTSGHSPGPGAGLDEHELVARARRAGVRVAAGSRFGPTRTPSVRLAFSFNSPALLDRAAQRLSTAWSGLTGRTEGTE